MSWRRQTLDIFNKALNTTGLKLVTLQSLEELALPRTRERPHFTFAGRSYPYFSHQYNCGWPAGYATERTVELALADAWLSTTPMMNVIEVGAVSPYYWPGRVPRIVDPADEHMQVSDRLPMDSIDMSGKDVLCISTLEHFGKSDYGLVPDPVLLRAAVYQLASQARTLLATVPFGYNPMADELFFGDVPLPGFRVGYLVRDLDRMEWRETNAIDARRPYTDRYAASAIAVIEK